MTSNLRQNVETIGKNYTKRLQTNQKEAYQKGLGNWVAPLQTVTIVINQTDKFHGCTAPLTVLFSYLSHQ